MRAPVPLGLEAAHFARWPALSRMTVRDTGTPAGAALLEARAVRIAQGSLCGIRSRRGLFPAQR